MVLRHPPSATAYFTANVSIPKNRHCEYISVNAFSVPLQLKTTVLKMIFRSVNTRVAPFIFSYSPHPPPPLSHRITFEHFRGGFINTCQGVCAIWELTKVRKLL